MKRGLIVLLLLVLLVSPLILAQEDTDPLPGGEDNKTIGTEGKKVENLFQRNATIPSVEWLYLYRTPRITFDVTWVELIVYLVTVAFIFITALEILSYTQFETAWVKITIAATITVVVGIFGLIQTLIDFFYNGLANFQIIMWGIVILIVAGLLIKPLMKGTKKGKRLDKAEALGTRAGAMIKLQSEKVKAIVKADATS
jgi:hypothetical protein